MKYAALAAALFALATPRAATAQDTAARPLAFAELPLERASQDAVVHSPDVAAAQAVVRENSAALGLARASIGPSLATSYAQAPQGGTLGNTITQSLTTVGVQTNLGDAFTYGPLVASAATALEAAQASLIAAERTERVKLIGLYYDALKARAIALARDEGLMLARRQRDASVVRLQAGDAPRLDVVRANVAVSQAIAEDETARATDQNATDALRVETGTQAALDRTVDLPVPAITPPGVDAAVTLALARRADLRAASDQTASAQAAARAAHRVFPSLSAGVGYTTGVDSGVDVHGPSANVTLSVPLSGAAHEQALQRDAMAAEQLAKEQSLHRQIMLEVASAVRSLGAANRATAASTQAREQAEAELRATQLGYRSGAISSLELSSARDTYTLAIVGELSALYEQLKAQAILVLETGP